MLPIPPGRHWSDEMPVLLPSVSGVEGAAPPARELAGPKAAQVKRSRKVAPPPSSNLREMGGLRAAPAPAPATPMVEERQPKKKPQEKKPRPKNDPKLVAAARELRDRWLEYVNAGALSLESAGKYDVTRTLAGARATPAFAGTERAVRALPEAA